MPTIQLAAAHPRASVPPRRFITVWGDGYCDAEKGALVEVVQLDFFSKERGYTLKEIEEANNLEVGQSMRNYDNGWHSIIRIA